MIDPRDADRARAVLGVPLGATPDQLRSRHRELVKTWHPDRFASDPRSQEEATAKMRSINAAYQLLSDLNTEPPTAPQRPVTAGTRLTQAQIDELVARIGSTSPVQELLDAIPIRSEYDIASRDVIPAGLAFVAAMGTIAAFGRHGATGLEILGSCALGLAAFFVLRWNPRWWASLAKPDLTPRQWVTWVFYGLAGAWGVAEILSDFGILP